MKAKTRVAVLVSGGGTNLQALIDAQAAGRLPDGEICAVISNKKGAFALHRAEEAGIPAFTVTKKASGGSQEAFEAALNDVLDACGAQLIVLAGFLAILSAAFTARWRDRIVNIHPSLIPAFCGKGYYGLRVHEAALERGGDTAETLQRRVMEQAEWILLPQAVELLSKQLREEDSSHD